MNKQITISIILILLLGASSLAATTGSTVDPSEIGVGARPMGMGKAFVGMANDGSAVFLNPAGLAGLKGLTMSSMYCSLLGDINYTVGGVAYPIANIGTLGLGYIDVRSGSIPVTTLVANRPYVTGQTSYGGGVLFLSYGNNLSKVARMLNFNFLETMEFGANLKIFSQGFTGGGATVEAISGSGMDLDLGLKFQPREYLSLGLNLQNILPSAMGKFTWKDGTVESIPDLYKLGGSLNILGDKALVSSSQSLTFGLDLDVSRRSTRPMTFHTGFEWQPLKMIALRLGLDQQPKSAAGGTQAETSLAAGVGINFAGYSFDYAYHPYGDVAENVTHYFSLGYKLTPIVEKNETVATPEVTTISPTLETAPGQVLSEAQINALMINVNKAIKAKQFAQAKNILGYILSRNPERTDLGALLQRVNNRIKMEAKAKMLIKKAPPKPAVKPKAKKK